MKKEIVFEKRIYLSKEERSSAYDVIFRQNPKGILLEKLIPKFLTAYQSSLVQTEILNDVFEKINLTYSSKEDRKICNIQLANEENSFCPSDINVVDPDNLLTIFIFNEQSPKNKFSETVYKLE